MCSPYLSINSHSSLINVRLLGYEPRNERGAVKLQLDFWGLTTVVLAVKAEALPERLQLVPLLQYSQFPPDFVEEVGALEAAAVAVKADDDGAEAADQNRGPVHPELLRHHLAAGCTVPVEDTGRTRTNHGHVGKMSLVLFSVASSITTIKHYKKHHLHKMIRIFTKQLNGVDIIT